VRRVVPRAVHRLVLAPIGAGANHIAPARLAYHD
jgi:hypothetical protein